MLPPQVFVRWWERRRRARVGDARRLAARKVRRLVHVSSLANPRSGQGLTKARTRRAEGLHGGARVGRSYSTVRQKGQTFTEQQRAALDWGSLLPVSGRQYSKF